MAENKYLYRQVYNYMKDKIMSEDWIQDEKIPSEHSLMRELNVSRYTIRKALDILENEGYIYRIVGSGTYVKTNKSRYRLNNLESFSEQMKARGLIPSSKIISIKKTKPNSNAKKALNIDNETEIIKLERIRLANDEPMCYEITYLISELTPGIDKLVIEDTSLYDLYENHYGYSLDSGDFILEAINCPDEYLKDLQIEKNEAVLFMQCVVNTKNLQPFYYVESYYIGSKYQFFTTIPRQK